MLLCPCFNDVMQSVNIAMLHILFSSTLLYVVHSILYLYKEAIPSITESKSYTFNCDTLLTVLR